jgi:hypothetical protein
MMRIRIICGFFLSREVDVVLESSLAPECFNHGTKKIMNVKSRKR